jgi:hypothetical protein
MPPAAPSRRACGAACWRDAVLQWWAAVLLRCCAAVPRHPPRDGPAIPRHMPPGEPPVPQRAGEVQRCSGGLIRCWAVALSRCRAAARLRCCSLTVALPRCASSRRRMRVAAVRLSNCRAGVVLRACQPRTLPCSPLMPRLWCAGGGGRGRVRVCWWGIAMGLGSVCVWGAQARGMRGTWRRTVWPRSGCVCERASERACKRACLRRGRSGGTASR